ncbi:MAG: hypothetical protein KDK89_00970 [Alphaproteobacteria bacterium]|nr:hypothetical protein [Alphaproteobacteria bacterium]
MTDVRSSFTARSLGSREKAERIANRALGHIKAYRSFVSSQGIGPDVPFEHLPLQDKESYLRQYPFADLLGDDFADTFTIFSSAGSAARSFYWPQLKTGYADAAANLRLLLETTYAIDRHSTLAVVGLALGSWIGGDILSWLLKDVAIATPYPFAVFSPGNKHEEIVSILRAAAGLVDRILLVCCPSAIGHLVLLAEQLGEPLPLEKMRYLVIGEPFPEALRLDLARRSGVAAGDVLMMSVYGSADTGVMGFESPATILLRQLCYRDAEIAASLGIEGVIPHFFHHADPGTYLEEVAGELCITRWQGIPLVRYNLHDQVQLFDWPGLVRQLSAQAERQPSLASVMPMLTAHSGLLPSSGIIAIAGRADFCLNLCGTKLSEAMLDEAMRSEDLADTLTGVYLASVVTEDGRQRLSIRLETRYAPGKPAEVVDAVYPRLVQAIGRAQPEFLDDWTNIYRRWDDDPARRILKLDLAPWPTMSGTSENRIKQHSIVP